MTDQPFQPVDFGLIERYLGAREEEQKRLAQMEAATERLTNEIQALTDALNTYATQTQVSSIEDILQDHENRLIQKTNDLTAVRLRVRRRTNIMFAVTLVLLIVTIIVGGYYIHREATVRRDLCKARNVQTLDQAAQTRAFFAPRLAQELKNPSADPVLVDILRTLATSQPKVVRC